MSITVKEIMHELTRVQLPDGSDIVAADMVRGMNVEGGSVRFVLEVPAEIGARMEPVRAAAEKLIADMNGVDQCSVMMTAHNAPKEPPKFENRWPCQTPR